MISVLTDYDYTAKLRYKYFFCLSFLFAYLMQWMWSPSNSFPKTMQAKKAKTVPKSKKNCQGSFKKTVI